MFRIFKFLATGGTAALINLSILYFCTERLDMWYIFAAVIAFTAAISFNFTFQRLWVFANQSSGGLRGQFSRFLIVALCGNAANASLLFIAVEIFSIWYLFAQVVVMGVLAVVNFFLYRQIFKVPLQPDVV